MARLALLFGVVLIALGVFGYANGPSEAELALTGKSKFTSLIPSFVGIALALCGLIAMAKPSLTKHTMHAAAMVGLLGFFGALSRPISLLIKGETLTFAMPLMMQLAMAGLCALFVALCVNSFIQAKKRRRAGA